MTQPERGLFGRSIERRAVLEGGFLAAAGLAAAALVGCGDDDEEDAPAAKSDQPGAAKPKALNEELLAVNDRNLPYPFVLAEDGKQPKSGGTYKVGWNQDLATFDPTKSTSASTTMVPNAISSRLLGFVGNHKLNPFKVQLEGQLAKSWERSPDGLTYNFNLVPGVKFQNVPPVNGRPFVAQDVKLVYERYAKEGVNRVNFEAVETMAAVNDTTFQVKLKRPQAEFDLPLGSRYLPIYPIEIADKGALDKSDMFVSMGPFILKEAVKGSHVTFTKNPDYWRGPVYLDGHEWRIMPDQAARTAAARTGQIDYATNLVGNAKDAETILKSNPDMQVYLLAAIQPVFSVSLNLKNPKFQDDRVRQALNLAHDRDKAAKVLYDGLAVPYASTLPWIFTFDAPPPRDQLGWIGRYDLAESKRLLSAAGAEKLEFELVYFNYDNTRNRAYNELLAADFAQAGVTMRIQSTDVTSFNGQWQRAEYKEAADGFATGGFGADTYYGAQLATGSSLNRWNISDPQIDEWAKQQSAELDPTKRRDTLRKIFERYAQKAYRVEKVANYAFEAHSPWVRNQRLNGALSSITTGGDVGTFSDRVWLDK